jgi:hypothetical protein
VDGRDASRANPTGRQSKAQAKPQIVKALCYQVRQGWRAISRESWRPTGPGQAWLRAARSGPLQEREPMAVVMVSAVEHPPDVNPANFKPSQRINNLFYPLPAGRWFVYEGTKKGIPTP